MTKERRTAIVGPTTSRRNKMALLAQCVADGDEVYWTWSGVAYRSRLNVSFGRGEPFVKCKSFDEDVLPTYWGPDD